MRIYSCSLATLAASAILLATTVGPAHAEDLDSKITEVVEIIETVAPDVGDIMIPTPLNGDFTVATEDAGVLIPQDPQTPIRITSTDPLIADIEVALPDLEASQDALQAYDGTIIYPTDNDASLAVQPFTDGSVRFLSVLENKHAPSSYDYVIEGATLELLQDGSVLVFRNGEPAGFVEAPWARDAEGRPVPTHYSITDNTITQVIEHTSGNFSYPIAADPWWNPFSWDWKKIGKVTVKGLKNCGLGALGVSTGTVGANVAINVGRSAAGKYLISIYGGPYGLIGVAAAGCVSNLIK